MKEKISAYFKPIAKKALSSAVDLFKIMIPILILVKIIQELNLLSYVVYPLEPIMALFGIPGVYALAWISAMFNNCYAALAVISMLAQNYPLSVLQVTVLSLMIAISHSLFVESAIMRQFGIKHGWSMFIRLFSSIIFGCLVYLVCNSLGILQDKAVSPLFTKVEEVQKTFLDLYVSGLLSTEYLSWLGNMGVWVLSQAKTILLITCIIFIIFTVIQVMKDIKLIDKINFLIKPLFKTMKISKNNQFIALICYLIGLSYGWGVLKEESGSNIYFKKAQAFKVLTFLAIVHAVVEDSLIFIFLGANAWFMVLGRTLWAFIVVVALSWFILPRVSTKFKNKYLYK